MIPFHFLDNLQAEDPQVVGRKAACLATLQQQGHPCVPGFVVTVPMWQQFLAYIDWGEPLALGLPAAALRVKSGDSYQLQSVAQQLQMAVRSQPLPQEWRSRLAKHIAALHSAALILRPSIDVVETEPPLPEGLFQSRLIHADLEAVADGIKAVWAQLFQASSLFYWQRRGISLDRVKLAVMIQPLLPAAASGDLEIEGGVLTIKSVQGLGYALTLGEALPEQYRLDFNTGQTEETAAQQAYAYWFEPAKSPTAEAERPSGLLTHMPSSLLQHRAAAGTVLGADQQQRLVALGKAIAGYEETMTKGDSAQGGSPRLKLEWLLCGDRGDAVYITQFTQAPAARPAHGSEPRSATYKAALPIGPQLAASHIPRSADLVGLGASPGRVQGPVYHVTSPEDWIPPKAILLAEDMTPDWMPVIQQAIGVITDQGSMTSHAAILTRELGIPAVVGASGATRLLQNGDRVLLDGDRGSITPLSSSASSSDATSAARSSESGTPKHRQALMDLARKSPFEPKSLSSREYRIRPIGSFCSLSLTPKAQRTKLMLNLSSLAQLYPVTNTPIDGIGLLRSELLLLPLLERRHPLHWLASGNRPQLIARIAAKVSQLAAAVFPDPVHYRTLDLRSDEFSHLEGSPRVYERNPVLGNHGTYSYGHQLDLFEAELDALKQVQQAGYSNLRLVLPFVRSVEEFTVAQQVVHRTTLNQVESFQLWIMAEVPSALLLLSDYVQAGVEGIAIGSNDLTQLLFAADRSQPELSSRFQAHPALLRAIQQMIEQAGALGIPSAICGDLPSQHPHLIASLIDWGIDTISVPPAAAAMVREAITAAEAPLSIQPPTS
ncbi:MAG: putative PEP-binding protein [Elainellaceae cyanobacterium]